MEHIAIPTNGEIETSNTVGIVVKDGNDYIIKKNNETKEGKAYSIGNTSDGYHTFNELYHHRAILFSVICDIYEDRAWKSLHHDDGTMFDGMFIVGIDTSMGQAAYHYDIDPYWDLFNVLELEYAPKFDGYTPDMALDRIQSLLNE